MEEIVTLIAVLIGWGLSEASKFFTEKKQDKKKLKKVLFYLLELRFHFAKELSFEAFFDNYITQIKIKIANKTQLSEEEIEKDTQIWAPIVKEIISKNLRSNNRLEFLENNIDDVINDLAEVFPIFAYELTGQHNIRNRLGQLENYFNEIQTYQSEHIFDIQKWLQPQLTYDLLKNIDRSIKKISSKIDSKTKKKAKKKISNMTFDKVDLKELDIFLDEIISKMN